MQLGRYLLRPGTPRLLEHRPTRCMLPVEPGESLALVHFPGLPCRTRRCDLRAEPLHTTFATTTGSRAPARLPRVLCSGARPPAESGVPSAAVSSPPASSGPVAFFDVDGTILRSNVVTAFLTLKLAEWSPAEKALWVPYFALQAVVYLALDRIDRAMFNRLFYRNYRGVSVGEKARMAGELHASYVLPRILPGAEAHIRALRAQGFRVVLVTGSLDFLMEPLAEMLQCDAVFAARLKEEHGRFSGELEGEAVSSQEKAALARQYAAQVGADLRECHAYGDSVADLAMLEAVGFPHAVRPEKRLRAIAEARGWPILDWAEQGAAPGLGVHGGNREKASARR